MPPSTNKFQATVLTARLAFKYNSKKKNNQKRQRKRNIFKEAIKH